MSSRAGALADLVTALEQDTSKLLARAADAEEAGTAGRMRASFQAEARQIHEKGTMVILKIDAMVGDSQGETEAQRDAARASRKRLAIRVQSCSKRLGPFL